MTDAEARARADRFWRCAGVCETFPRSLERAVLWAVPLAVMKLPRLGLSELRTWLRHRGQSVSLDGPDRPLRACLIARNGRGIVVLDGTDTEDERRLSLAHELAHFLLDYLEPRERAVSAFGPTALEILDGIRPPSIQERVAGVLKGVTVNVHLHILERSVTGDVNRLNVLDAEDRADRLALELLAPRDVVLQQLSEMGVQWSAHAAVDKAAAVLTNRFGLPAAVADNYGRFLVSSRRAHTTFRDWLGC